MQGWEVNVSTGNADRDRAMIEHHRQAAAAQGLALQTQPLPHGGFVVRAVPAQAAWGAAPNAGGQAGYGVPGPQGWGAPQAAPQAQAGWGAAQPAPQAQAAGWGAQGPSAYGGFGGQAAMSGLGAGAGVAAADVPLGEAKLQHLRKVYGLLAGSAAVAILCGFLMLNVGGTVRFTADGGRAVQVPMLVAAMLESPALLYGSFALLFFGTLAAGWVSKIPGVNVAALFGVSALMGIELAPMVFVAQVFAGFGETMSLHPVRDTFAIVGAVFVGSTSYVFITRKDFSFLKAILNIGFWVVFAACLLSFVFDTEAFSLAVASVGALLAAGFLLYNTSRILHDSEMDDAVGDALGLIVQLRNLFLFILRILMSNRR